MYSVIEGPKLKEDYVLDYRPSMGDPFNSLEARRKELKVADCSTPVTTGYWPTVSIAMQLSRTGRAGVGALALLNGVVQTIDGLHG